jgi:hypothetical protein
VELIPDRLVDPLRIARARGKDVDYQQMHAQADVIHRLGDKSAEFRPVPLVARRNDLDDRDHIAVTMVDRDTIGLGCIQTFFGLRCQSFDVWNGAFCTLIG